MSYLCIGHRGASGHAPENTLKAFGLAISMGCPWIELDVYWVDDHLMVIHDDDVDRTTNGTGAVMDLSFSQLRALDAGEGQKIPTLEEVLELCDKRIGINVELKGPNTAAPVSQLLNKQLALGWQADQFLISSFYHDELALADPLFKRGALFHKEANYVERARNLGAYAINVSDRLINADLVKEAQSEGFKVLVYTVNTLAEMTRLKDMGVDGVFTNFPDQFPQ